jgi:RNA polymerase sigma factor (sigma-70 family)
MQSAGSSRWEEKNGSGGKFSSFADAFRASIDRSAGVDSRRNRIMATGNLSERVAATHAANSSESMRGAADSELLDNFLYRGDQAAFATLVQRYGPMVLGVCQRILRHTQDAEDAFQATFLVLVRKGATLAHPGLLANWLYGVAYRTAQHARARAARRSRHEREAASMTAAISDPPADQELSALLDEEISRLPEKYRDPLVLCYLQGLTNEQAARVLGWPTGSMSSRLARARELLRERLERRLRGLPCATRGGFTALLADIVQRQPVPRALADATVEAAEEIAGGGATADVLAPSVAELLEATLRGLPPGRRQATALPLLALVGGVVATAAGWGPPSISPNPALPGDTPPVSSGSSSGCCHPIPVALP